MASNFRGTRRKLYNPSEVKFLSENEARKEYAALRKIANRRASRLREAGYGGTELAETNFPPQSSLSGDDVEKLLLDVSVFLRDPRTTRPGMRAYEESMKESLSKYKEVISKNPKKFGDFMETLRKRAGGQLKASEYIRVVYEETVLRGMRPKTLEKHFDAYLLDEEKVKEVAKRVKSAPMKGRFTYRKMGEMIDDV